MNLRTRPKQLAAAVAALTCVFVVIPVVALAAPSTIASSARPARIAIGSSPCSRAHLMEWFGEPGYGTAGTIFYELEFSNVSRHACTLKGFPGVTARNASGHQLGSAAGHETGSAEVPHLVTLAAAGGTAHAVLGAVDTGALPTCQRTTASYLQIYGPGQHSSGEVFLSIGACKNKGPIFMRVTPIKGGVGVPDYSF